MCNTSGALVAQIQACRLCRYAPKAELVAGDDTYTAEMEALLVSNVFERLSSFAEVECAYCTTWVRLSIIHMPVPSSKS